MNFRRLQLSDVPVTRPFFEKLASRTCDFTVGGMFMWRDFFHMEFSVEKEALFSRLFSEDGRVYYNLPLADNIPKAVAELVNSLTAEEGVIRFCTVPENYLPVFDTLGRTVSAAEQRTFADYMYAANDLIALKGKKYSAVRNQISQFARHADSWVFRKMRPEDAAPVCDFFCESYLPAAAAGPYEQEENRKVLEVLKNMDTYGMTGGILLADGAIAGFSLHEIIRDTLYIHIEKADRRFKGAYQMLMNQTAAAFAVNDVAYINREEDMGDPGLRKAKESYHPIGLLKKYIVEVK